MKRIAYFTENAPEPGEPFVEKIHPENRAILQAELEERLKILKDRLDKRTFNKTYGRMIAIKKRLDRARYKQLCIDRERCYQKVTALSERWKKTRKESIKKQGLKEIQRGKALNAKIQKLQPLIDEFILLKNKLDAHQRVVNWLAREKQKEAQLQEEASNFQGLIEAAFAQNPKLHFLKYDSKGNRKVKLPIIKKAQVFPDSILFRIQTTKQNILQRIFGRWSSAIPYGVDPGDLISDETMLSMTVMTGRNVTVVRNSKTQNIFYRVSRLDGNSGLPDQVLYEHLIEFYPSEIEQHIKMPWNAGIDANNSLVQFDFQTYPHVLVAGTTGGGKSNFMNQMLACLLAMNSPAELRCVFIDNKGGVELKNWEGVPHQLMPMCRLTPQIIPTLEEVERVMNERYDLFYKCKVTDIGEYNEKFTPKLPRILLTIDEMASLAGLGKETTSIHSLLRNITSLGRAAGVHAVLFTQHPTVDIIPGWVKANLVLRIATKVPNHNNSQVIVDSNTAADLEDKPGRMVARVGPREIIFQSPLILPQSIAKARALAMSYAPETTESAIGGSESPAAIIPRPVKPQFGREDFLNITLGQMGGKISASGVQKLVGDEVMSLYYMRELVNQILEDAQNDDGFIEHEGVLYTLKKMSGRGSYKMIRASEESSEDDLSDDSDNPPNSEDSTDIQDAA